jgi:hypothetical protein
MLQIKAPSYDFGTVVQRTVVLHSFEIQNAGSAQLQLAAENQALGCVARAQPQLLGPGAVGRLDVSCQTEFYGPLRVTLPLASNSLGGGSRELSLAAEVTPLLAFDTPLIDLSLPFATEQSAQAQLIGARAGQARLTLETLAEAGFELRAVPPDADAVGRLRLRVKAKKVGVWVGRLIFKTELPEVPTVELPYSFKVTGSLSVTPETPYFDLSAAGPKVNVVTVVSSQPGFTVRNARVLDGPFSATVTRSGGDAHYQITITVREDQVPDEARSVTGRLLIVSDDRSEPQKELPLFGFGTLNRTGTK